MQVRCKVPLSQIVVVDHLPITPRTLALLDHLRRGGTVPPLHVYRYDSGLFRVLDGRHRWLALKLLGVTHVWVRYGRKVSNETC